MQSRLENALSKNSISIKLQPQVDFRTGMIVGAEALARWVDEERGEIPPSQFILQCERVGRLDELTKRILRKSFSASKEMQDEGLDATVSVNVSAIQFVDHRIADLIERTLVETEADPLRIIIEMTESARVDDFGTAREIMERLKRTGIRFSIDDFGVASANLDALYQLPFDELKIDRMFVDAVTRSPAAQAIVANMVRLAKDMRITSVAEGIETREIFEKIQELGCDTAQGYYLARPQAFSQLKETLLLQRDSFGGRKTYG
ncbi:MAG: EAL domain-containing protein [Pseudomonadota bacterium]